MILCTFMLTFGPAPGFPNCCENVIVIKRANFMHCAHITMLSAKSYKFTQDFFLIFCIIQTRHISKLVHVDSKIFMSMHYEHKQPVGGHRGIQSLVKEVKKAIRQLCIKSTYRGFSPLKRTRNGFPLTWRNNTNAAPVFYRSHPYMFTYLEQTKLMLLS